MKNPANESGSAHHAEVLKVFAKHGFRIYQRGDGFIQRGWFCRQEVTIPGIPSIRRRIDFLAGHSDIPDKWHLAIEAKYQGSTGSIDKKLVSIIHEAHAGDHMTIVVVGGDELKRNPWLLYIKKFANKSTKFYDIVDLDDLDRRLLTYKDWVRRNHGVKD